MGRLLGVGSGGERVAPAVAHEHRVPAFDHDPGEARDAAEVERHARRRRRSCSSIFGTFITRSGVIESVHSFAQSPVGTWFAAFLIVAIGVTAISSRRASRISRRKAELESMVSREAAFLYNNLVLVGIAFSVLWGTLFPIISECGARHEDHGRSAVLQHGEHSARPAAARAHGRRAAHRVAPGVGRRICKRQFAVAGRRRARRRRRCCSRSACATCYALVAYTLAGFVAGDDRAGVLQGHRRAAIDARRGAADRRSCGSSRAIAGATAATSCTPASSCCSRRSPGSRSRRSTTSRSSAGDASRARRSATATVDVREPGRLDVRDARTARSPRSALEA